MDVNFGSRKCEGLRSRARCLFQMIPGRTLLSPRESFCGRQRCFDHRETIWLKPSGHRAISFNGWFSNVFVTVYHLLYEKSNGSLAIPYGLSWFIHWCNSRNSAMILWSKDDCQYNYWMNDSYWYIIQSAIIFKLVLTCDFRPLTLTQSRPLVSTPRSPAWSISRETATSGLFATWTKRSVFMWLCVFPHLSGEGC